MKNLYNKILKEALDIMDFDSWDDSENVFKDEIINKLRFKFIFEVKVTGSFKVLNVGHKGQNQELIGFWNEMKLKGYPKEYPYHDLYNKIMINGKRAILNLETGWPMNHQAEVQYIPGEYIVYIEGLEKLPHYYSLFYNCRHLKEVKGLLPMRSIKTTTDMFGMCTSLKSITLQDMSNVLWTERMFEECWNLDEETRKAWQINRNGTPLIVEEKY